MSSVEPARRIGHYDWEETARSADPTGNVVGIGKVVGVPRIVRTPVEEGIDTPGLLWSPLYIGED